VSNDALTSGLSLAAFAIVSAGAVPAPFRHPEIAWLRAPVVGIFVAAVAVIMLPRRANP
jgi:hypothetical protein